MFEDQRTWCIYIDEAGVNDEPQFVYTAICIPFTSQQDFLGAYSEIVSPLMDRSGKEIKYGDLLNTPDRFYREQTAESCQLLLRRFFEIRGARIIRVKAIRKKMRAEGNALRLALFRKTLERCQNALPLGHHAMILHDELNTRSQQHALLDTFNRFNSDKNFQNCVFVHSNENPLIQFADFIASICYRYYYFQQREYKDKRHSERLVKRLFETIDERMPRIVELSDHTDVEGNRRKRDALQLASEHGIDLATAYQIVDGKFTIEEALRRKEARTFAAQRRNKDKSENR